jgi:UPF0042 nucleotide-binding protein
MSGAGRSQAAKVLEDVGYFVVDNLPPSLIFDVVEHVGLVERRSRLAVVVDSRHGLSFADLESALRDLERAGIATTLLFLDATDGALITRYEEGRRPHPVAAPTLAESIATERDALVDLRGEADVIIDTTDRNVHQLRRSLEEAFSGGPARRQMRVEVTSFGFKHGVPRVLDLLFDVRFLPNPHWVPELRPLTGVEAPVRDYVLGEEDAREFLGRVTDLLDFLVPRYAAEGKSYLAIGIGCTGGNHRSVVMATEIAGHLADRGVEVTVTHRDAGS